MRPLLLLSRAGRGPGQAIAGPRGARAGGGDGALGDPAPRRRHRRRADATRAARAARCVRKRRLGDRGRLAAGGIAGAGAALRRPGAMEALVRTLRQLVEGESRQIALRGSHRASPPTTRCNCRLKTGSLFAFCGEAGALAARAPAAVAAALRDFGLRAGSAFQIARRSARLRGRTRPPGQGRARRRDRGQAVVAAGHRAQAAARAARGDGGAARLTARRPEEEVRARMRAFAARLSRTGALGAARRIAEKERDAAPSWRSSGCPKARPASFSRKSPARFSHEEATMARPDMSDRSRDAGAGPAARGGRRRRRPDGVLGLQAGDGPRLDPAYLRGEPLSAAELCDQLAISSGAASMALSELEHWAVVRRTRAGRATAASTSRRRRTSGR